MSVRIATSAAADEVRVVGSGGIGGTGASNMEIWVDQAWEPADYRFMSYVLARLNELLALEDNWDGYGASRVDVDAAERLLELLATYAGVVKSTPVVSATIDGGVVARWENGGFTTQLESKPGGTIDVYFVSDSGEEHEMAAVHAASLPKWLWQASLTI